MPVHQEHTMSDNILSAVLTFSLLVAGTAAMGSEMVASRHRAPAPAASQIVVLPAVTITGHRTVPTEVVMLPAVTVTGHRA
jgi:hypothetical protein